MNESKITSEKNSTGEWVFLIEEEAKYGFVSTFDTATITIAESEIIIDQTDQGFQFFPSGKSKLTKNDVIRLFAAIMRKAAKSGWASERQNGTGRLMITDLEDLARDDPGMKQDRSYL